MYFNDSNDKSIKQLIEELYKNNRQMSQKIDEQRIIKNYPQVVGPLIHKYTDSIFIKNGTLFLKISSSVVKNELTYAREKLCKSLNETVDEEIIKKIILL